MQIKTTVRYQFKPLRITICSNNVNSGYLSKGNKNTSLKKHLHSMFTTVLFINMIAKTWKLPQYPLVDEWIKKMWSGRIPRSLTVKSLATGPPPCIRDRVPHLPLRMVSSFTSDELTSSSYHLFSTTFLNIT